jgi:NADPH:quinone reductase-like Zn-dependent oxidoreductase
MIGVVSGPGQIDPRQLISRAVRLQGLFVGSRDMFAAMNAAVAASRLRPVIDSVFPFERAREAYARLQSGSHFGKVVVAV